MFHYLLFKLENKFKNKKKIKPKEPMVFKFSKKKHGLNQLVFMNHPDCINPEHFLCLLYIQLKAY